MYVQAVEAGGQTVKHMLMSCPERVDKVVIRC